MNSDLNQSPVAKGFSILVVAPHADDETLGLGGTIARFVDEGHRVTVAVMTGEGSEPHPFVTRESIATVRAEFGRAMDVLGVTETLFHEFATTLLDTFPQYQINKVAAEIVEHVRPDMVFLPFEHDLHKDHEILNYAFRVALRPHLPSNRVPHMVLSYETPTETHLQSPHLRPSFEPNFWVDISAQLERKLKALSRFESQIPPAPGLRSVETLRALATWRGSQIGVRAAEAFMLLRQVI
jgi:LmbE family N-acetylglucosaminyl deacetylase